jgi:hypothetical protein
MPVQTQMQVRRGTASSWTSTNPTLAAGELGFETDTGKFKIGTGASTWTALLYAGGGQNTLTTYQYTATAGQTTFSGADVNGITLSYNVGSIQVYLNGALLANTTDYAATTGTSVVLTAGAGLGDSLTILSLATFAVASTYTQAQADALFIADTIFDAKGDIIAATAADTASRLAVGANDTVLTADSTTATGLKWATVAAGSNWTLLNTGGTTLTGGSTVTVSGISSKDKIMVLVQSASTNTGQAQIAVRINGDTGYNYKPFGFYISNNNTYSPNEFNTIIPNTEWIKLASMTASDGSTVSGFVQLTGCSSSGVKMFIAGGGATPNGSTNGTYQVVGGFWDSSASVTSVSVASGNTLDGGTVFVYTSA